MPHLVQMDKRYRKKGLVIIGAEVQGSDDAYGTEKQVKAIVSQVSGPVTSQIISNCGHAPHLECPEAVLDIMQE